MSAPAAGPSALERYYQFHSRIYDATRWSFLFGRNAILDHVPALGAEPARILEVGCGTGRNLAALARRFPAAQITGVDLSDAMLGVARAKVAKWEDRVQLQHRAYDGPLSANEPYDLVLFSYALTMFNPGFETALEAAQRDLAPGGLVAVVDFHDSQFPWFERWMGLNHVRMNGQLQPMLRRLFQPKVDEVHPAYGGVWRYLIFIGARR